MRIIAPSFLLLPLLIVAACTKSGAPGSQAVAVKEAPPATAPATDALAPANPQALAKRIVTQSLRLREGDRVLIGGSVRDAALMEDLAVEAAAVGADPMITISSDRLVRLLYDRVPAKYDTLPPKFGRSLFGIVDAQIMLDTNQDPNFLEGVPPARLAARGKALTPLNLVVLKRGIRSAYIGNWMYPTAANAQLFGIPQAELAHMFWGAMDVDYTQLQATAARVQGIFAKGKEVHVTNPNGTDLTASIAGRPVLVSDGVVSPEDERRGGAAAAVSLPAGEVFLAAVPGTAHGTIVCDRLNFMGKVVEGLHLTVEKGKVTAMTATSGLEPLKAAYDASGSGKDLFGSIDVGVNPALTIPQGSHFANWVVAGMVTLTFGNDVWAGGSNNSPFGVSLYVPGSTLTVDGAPLVKDGSLQPAQAPQVAKQ